MNFDNIRKTWRRAKSFGLTGAEIFIPEKCEGAEIAAANFCLLLDATPELKTVEDYVDDLVLFDTWAISINKACDSRMITDSPDIQNALKCFASRLWFDPSQL